MRKAVVLVVVWIAMLVAPARTQQALLWREHQLTVVPVAVRGVAAAISRVVAGPDAAQSAAGYTSAVPAGTTLLAVAVAHGRCAVTLDAGFLPAIDSGTVEDAIEQLTKTALQLDPSLFAVDLFVVGRDGRRTPLTELLGLVGPQARAVDPNGPAIQSTVNGALTGRTIALSAGHGYYWHSSLGWTTQRGLIDGLIEDVHTNEITLRWLAPFLENLGATVLTCRERSESESETITDDGQSPPAFAISGAWTASASAGYAGGGYRFASTAPGATDRATWRLSVSADGNHPVYAWFRSGTNRSTAARYEITHAGGTDVVLVDQTSDGSTWRYLGEWWFRAQDGVTVALSADAPAGRVVIADAIRAGGGRGTIARGAGTSGRAKWLEAARYWAQYCGAASSVWDSISGGQDNDDDVTTRPRFAEWRGADAFVSLHTNAGGGLGTSTYIYDGGATAGSSTLQARVHDQIVADLRAEYEPGWTDRGKLQANFGEVRLLSTMPGVLVELAFHDTPGSVDHRALHDPRFRRIAGRAMARGVLRYFSSSAAFPPEPPSSMRVVQDGARGLAVQWNGSSGATEYSIERSADGKGFAEVARTSATAWSTGPLAPGTAACFRVRAWNASGRSFPTEVLCGMTTHHGGASLLLVQAFDRLERTVKEPDNTFDYLPRHLIALQAARAFSLAVDSASNEAVQLGAVVLADYRCVDWACGEESTAHESFSGYEQTLVRNYAQAGGRLLVSGAEIGWDLEARGSAGDLAFHRQVLGAAYVADDAGTYGFRARTGGIFAGLSNGTFDDGSGPTYDVDYPDVLAPADASSSLALEYATGTGAAIQRDSGASRVVYLGFPIETIRDDALRGQVMQRALRYLLAPQTLQAPESVLNGSALSLAVEVPSRGGAIHWLMAALATAPAIQLPGGFVLGLAPDALFFATLDPGNPLLGNFLGNLDAQGRATASFLVPPIPGLAGIDLYFAGLLLDAQSGAITDVLNWARTTIR
ncbi:MAG: N-acetylmuramoyl-L-alanine amidase [Planctomycetes bacterium]|nr:N-acetylmuramoyl-L-alanine amidase [Planctomycetota bacterium]